MDGANPAEWSNTAHIEQTVKVHYPYHPFYGQELAVVRADKNGLVFVKARDGSFQGLPRWMTDASVCRHIESSSYPYCSVQALQRLRELIRTFRSGDSIP